MRYRVIIEQPTWRRWIFWVAATVLLVVAAGAGALWGVAAAQEQIRENADLNNLVQQLNADNSELRSTVTDSELTIETQKATAVALRDELTQLHQVNAELETQLGFFRKIMAPGEMSAGVQIERLDIRGQGGNEWLVQMTLIHVAERHSVVKGEVQLSVIDGVDGAEIPIAKVKGGANNATLDYRFRYFQTMEQAISLPPTADPKTLKVTVFGRKGVVAETEFPWPVS